MANNQQTCLLLVDIQTGLSHPTFYGTTRSTPDFSTNITALLSAFRSMSARIIHVVHHSTNVDSPLHPSSPGVAICDFAQPLPSETVMSKSVNSAFIGTRLEDEIRASDIRRLVICGLTTDHCVSTTVRMAANLGVVDTRVNPGQILLVGDGTAAFNKGSYNADLVHQVHLASLDGEFCRVKTTKEILQDARNW